MMKLKCTAATLIAMAMMSAPALADAGHAAHSPKDSFSAGEPGDPKKPARIVQITVGETDGKMFFSPAQLEI